MLILSRHIIRQLIGPFFFGFFVVTLMFMLNLVFKELARILSKGLEFWIVLEFFALNLAWITALAVPMGVLMACLMVFGQLSADYEITAIKSSGISLYRVIAPALLVAIGLTFFLAWFNNYVLPDTNHRLRLLARDITMKKPTVNLEPGYLYEDIPDITIRVENLEEKEGLSLIEDVLIHDKKEANINRSIIAHNGEILVNKLTGLLQVTLFDVEIHEVDNDKLAQYNRSDFEKYIMNIPIPAMVLQRRNSEYRGDREQSAQMMRTEIEKNNQLIKKRKENLNKYIHQQFERFFPEEKTGEQEKALIDSIVILSNSLKTSARSKTNLEKQVRINKNILRRINSEMDVNRSYFLRNNKLAVEVHKKYSIPFACIVFVFIGAPLGIMAHRGNMAVSGGISLIFFIIYWIFLIGGEELADRDLLSPFLSMWLANFIVGGFGIYLLIRTAKEVSVINFSFLTKLVPKRFR
ncbi:LptF/LptG family permease [candidate division KSB1 bacterium]|nr:LptF/LptG family permease [candidate division KSB1 bacterium]MBL7094157.1 LptF/LptG family permease [candidate division KSB1 bacterium]